MKIRVGIMGAGAIADDHCQNLMKNKSVELAAVADISPERREQVKKTYGMAKAYENWKDLADDPDIDAVVVALPNSLHAPVSLAAISSGKHVLLEKPFAMNYREAKKVADAAKRKGVVLMVGMNQRYRKESQMLRAIVSRGDLGELYHVKTYWYRRMGAPRFGTWFVNKKLSGGGCLLDIGVHYLDLALYMAGNWSPVSVSGKVYGKFGCRGIGEGGWGKSDRNARIAFDVEDFAVGLIHFKNGMTLELNVSWVIHQEAPNRNNVELFGAEAGASFAPLTIFRPSTVPGGYDAVQIQDVKLDHRYDNRQSNWVDAILGVDKPLCTVEQSLVVQKILDAIYESSRTGRDVRIN
jgi:predicted dehydrogenase